MRAKYLLKGEDHLKKFEHPVIVPQAMQHGDGFTLLGFNDWEDVSKEELCAAVTNVGEFHITKDSVGFGNDKE